MHMPKGFFLAALLGAMAGSAFAADHGTAPVKVTWSNVTRVSDTVPTTQMLNHKYSLRDSPIHDPFWAALKDLKTEDTRLQLWFSITNTAVPELKEPTATETFWNFTYMDQLMADFYANTSGRHHINMGTIPRWMFDVPTLELPTEAGASFYKYTEGTKGSLLKDPTGKQFANYQARIYQWYTRGGFTDELGKFHKSGHHYKIEFWDVCNEPDFENAITVEQYTKIYDAVTEAIHKIDPNVQFFAPEVSGSEVPWAKYFLDMKNHKPGTIPIQWFTYHNYVEAKNDPSTWQEKFFTAPSSGPTDGVSVNSLAERTKEVLKIRDELSPKTKIAIDELGNFLNVKEGEEACRADEPYSAYPALYWNAEGANWAANFIMAQNAGMPIFSMSQMIGYPTQCPSISMFDKDTARPNAHYWALHLISHNFGPGDKLVATQAGSSDLYAQASVTKAGRKILLVNSSNQPLTVDLSSTFSSGSLHAQIVDEKSGEQAPRQETLTGTQIELAPFAITVVSQGK
jgi:hypothetical protein